MRSLLPVIGLLLLGGAPSQPTNEVIRVNRLELVDADGNVRAVLATDRTLPPSLTFLDAKGTARARVGIDLRGSPALTLRDAAGNERVALQFRDSTSVASLGFTDAADKQQLFLLAGTDPKLASLELGDEGITLLTTDKVSSVRAASGGNDSQLVVDHGEARMTASFGKQLVSVGANAKRTYLER